MSFCDGASLIVEKNPCDYAIGLRKSERGEGERGTEKKGRKLEKREEKEGEGWEMAQCNKRILNIHPYFLTMKTHLSE